MGEETSMTNAPKNTAITVVDSTPYTVESGYTQQTLIDAWLRKQPTENTRVAYKHDIESFLAYVDTPLQDITLSTVQSYADTLTDLKTSTQARKLASVKSLLTFAHRTGYTRVNVGSMVDLPAIRSRLAERILTREQVESMI